MKLVLGDIHGHYAALNTLLDFASPGSAEPIFPLGDLIDRGPESNRVLIWARTTPQVSSILGNHEEMWLNVLRSAIGQSLNRREQSLAEHWAAQGNGAIETLRSLGFVGLGDFLSQPIDYLDDWRTWLETLPLWQEVDEFILAHAGIDSTLPLTAQPRETLLWERNWLHRQTEAPIPTKTLLVGHTPTWSLRRWITDFQPGDLVGGPGWINLDTGSQIPEYSWLSGLDLESNRVFQVNLVSQAKRSFHLHEHLKFLR